MAQGINSLAMKLLSVHTVLVQGKCGNVHVDIITNGMLVSGSVHAKLEG